LRGIEFAAWQQLSVASSLSRKCASPKPGTFPLSLRDRAVVERANVHAPREC
jgi:hypothetical protein